MSHERYIKLIDEILVGELATESWSELRAHLSGCASCRARYDRVALAERMLHGGPEALARPSAAALERIGAAVLDGVAPARPAWQRALQWFAPTQRWAVGLAAAAAVAVLVPFLLRSPNSGFQARGGAHVERSAGVRAFCIGAEGVTPRCARSTQLRLTVSNGGKFQRLFLVGVDDEWNIKWYAPRPPEQESIVAPEGVDREAAPAVRLGVNHDVGKVRIYALFSDSPLTSPEVEAAAERLHEAGTRPSERETLPLLRTDVVQKSVVLEVE